MADQKKPKFPTAPGTRSDLDADIVPRNLRPADSPQKESEPRAPHPALAAGVRITERAAPTMVPEVTEPQMPEPPRVQVVVPSNHVDDVPPVRAVKVEIERIKPPTKSELLWMRARVLGTRAKVFHLPDGSAMRAAGYAAAMIRSYEEETPNKVTVFVRVRFSPDLGPTWDHKLRAKRRERYVQLKQTLVYALARVQLTPGLVLRFAGVPGMTKDEAMREGYHVWTEGDRAAVIGEWTSDFIVAHRRKLSTLYTETSSQNPLVRVLKIAWWSLFDRGRLNAYYMGARVVRGGDVVISTTRGVKVLEAKGSMTTAARKVAIGASKIVAPVIQSLVSLAFGESSKYRELMLKEGVFVADVQGTRLGTLMDEESVYEEDPNERF